MLYENVGAGVYHTCGLTSVGGMQCWGNNGWGKITVPP